MTVSRQSDSKLLDKQSVRMMKLTDGQTRLHYIGTINDDNGCSTTAAGSAAAAVQTVVGGPHTRRRRGRQRGREAPPPEKYVYICHVSAILDMLSTEPPVCLTNEQKRRRHSKQKVKYIGYDRHIGTQT